MTAWAKKHWLLCAAVLTVTIFAGVLADVNPLEVLGAFAVLTFIWTLASEDW